VLPKLFAYPSAPESLIEPLANFFTQPTRVYSYGKELSVGYAGRGTVHAGGAPIANIGFSGPPEVGVWVLYENYIWGGSYYNPNYVLDETNSHYLYQDYIDGEDFQSGNRSEQVYTAITGSIKSYMNYGYARMTALAYETELTASSSGGEFGYAKTFIVHPVYPDRDPVVSKVYFSFDESDGPALDLMNSETQLEHFGNPDQSQEGLISSSLSKSIGYGGNAYSRGEIGILNTQDEWSIEFLVNIEGLGADSQNLFQLQDSSLAFRQGIHVDQLGQLVFYYTGTDQSLVTVSTERTIEPNRVYKLKPMHCIGIAQHIYGLGQGQKAEILRQKAF
jgi:hypothetical protein